MKVYSINMQQNHLYNVNFRANAVTDAQRIIDNTTSKLVKKGSSLGINEIAKDYITISSLIENGTANTLVHQCEHLLSLMSSLTSGRVLGVILKGKLDDICQKGDYDEFKEVVNDKKNTEIFKKDKTILIQAYENIINKACEDGNYQMFSDIIKNIDVKEPTAQKFLITTYKNAFKLKKQESNTQQFINAQKEIMQLINNLTNRDAEISLIKDIIKTKKPYDFDAAKDNASLIDMLEEKGRNEVLKFLDENYLMLGKYFNQICKDGNVYLFEQEISKYKKKLKENPEILKKAAGYLEPGKYIPGEPNINNTAFLEYSEGYWDIPTSTTLIRNIIHNFKKQCRDEDLQEAEQKLKLAIENNDLKTIEEIVYKWKSSLSSKILYKCYCLTVNHPKSKVYGANSPKTSDYINELTNGKIVTKYLIESLNNAKNNEDFSTCIELCLINKDKIKEDKGLYKTVKSLILDINNNSDKLKDTDKAKLQKLLITLI